jgi:hypothetical protein
MKYHPKNDQADKKARAPKKVGALKGFFKSGENYVPHLSRKGKILARVLEDANQNSND